MYYFANCYNDKLHYESKAVEVIEYFLFRVTKKNNIMIVKTDLSAKIKFGNKINTEIMPTVKFAEFILLSLETFDESFHLLSFAVW